MLKSKELSKNKNILVYFSFITSVFVLCVACISNGGIILASSNSNTIQLFDTFGALGDDIYENLLSLVNVIAAIWFTGNLIKIIVVSSDRSMDQAKKKLFIIFVCICLAHGIGFIFQLADDVTKEAPSLDTFDVGIKSISPSK